MTPAPANCPPPGPLMIDVAGTTLNAADRALLAEPAIGSLILFTRNFRDRTQLAELTADIRAVRPNILIVADYEGGRVQRFRDGFTEIPSMASLGWLYAEAPDSAIAAARTLGWLVARELREVGIDMPLAPVVDRDYGHSRVIGHRAFSSDPRAIGELAMAYSQGLAEGGSAATIKHFPGHGWVAADSHAELPVDDRSRAALAADWQPFSDVICAGVASVMMAHVHYPAVDRHPASLSSRWIKDILRGELDFQGTVFCDDLSMGGAVAFGDIEARVGSALAAGCDVLPVCNDRAAAMRAAARCERDLVSGAGRRAALATQCVADASAGAAQDTGRREQARTLAARLRET